MAEDLARSAMDIKQVAVDYDVLAPDGSEIRFLSQTGRGSMVHCTLNPGEVSLAVAHRSVEEVWYFLEGAGEVWRQQGDIEKVDEVLEGVSLSIPTGVHFQFRASGAGALRFMIVTMPPWPGEDEAYRVPDHWPTDG
jgi:mannose-6-phosphate isomerase-like protein (cupin superfamily)